MSDEPSHFVIPAAWYERARHLFLVDAAGASEAFKAAAVPVAPWDFDVQWRWGGYMPNGKRRAEPTYRPVWRGVDPVPAPPKKEAP